MTADLLPLALAIAASPFPVVPAILLSLTPRATANGAAFLAGWAAGILAGTALFVGLAAVVEGVEETPEWVSWARVLLGAGLVVVGLRQWLSRGEAPEAPAWVTSIDAATPVTAARLALLLSAANPKILVLSAAAGLTIADAAAAPAWAALAVLGSVSVALPLLAHVVLGERANAPLLRAKDWLTRHNATIMAVVILVIGVVLLAKGMGGL